MQKPKVLVIAGPTASGKTSLSINLAKQFNGEIISADSRQIYQGLNLGTGKVTHEEMAGVPHHLLDVVNPTTVYTVADFVRDGRAAIAQILDHQKLPIIVGGTFFYIDALIGNVTLPEVPPNESLRLELEAKNTDELFALLEQRDPRRASMVDAENRRRIIRALEISNAIGSVPPPQSEPLFETLTLGIKISKEELHKNIHTRLLTRLEAGMIDEVRNLHEQGLSYERLDDLGLEYRYISRYLQGKISYDTMVAELETKIRQYAKRQMTWLKRDRSILWVSPKNLAEIESIIINFMQ